MFDNYEWDIVLLIVMATKTQKLLIVESPSKAKTIEKYLGGEFLVRASIGHIRDLPKSNKKAIDIEHGFVPHYEISKGKDKVVAELSDLSKKAKEVVIATDPDREGEAIAWHIKETIGLKNPKRIVFHEVTEEAIKEALATPRAIDENLRRAQEARRVLDRLVGYDLSGIIWKKVRYGLSAGRVQSPALRIIMEREREIRAFIPENYFILRAHTKTGKNIPITFTCDTELRDEKEALRIVSLGEKSKWSITDIKETEVKRSPRAPFITSTLQQTASTRLGFSPSRTMQLAQKLYEAGHITYMRTDSTNLSKVALSEIYGVIDKKYGKDFVSPRTYTTKSKNAQEAHEAIRPTHATKIAAGSNDSEKKLYELIWARTVSSQMSDARLLRTKITALPDSKEPVPTFGVTGSVIVFPGWLSADPDAQGEETTLPKVVAGDPLTLVSMEKEDKQTEPPSRYTEAGLIKELEKREIGRPSTYASIIDTIVKREYVNKQGKTLFPTDVGEVVSDFLETNFPQYISDSFTKEMEDTLDDIAEGKKKYENVLKNFYGPFLKDVKSKEKLEKATNLGKADPKWKCPVCGGGMVIKLSRGGKFLSCERFPDCVGARALDGSELEGPKETGELCPECKTGKLIERDGRYGRFVACSNYPKCKFVKEDETEAAKKNTGVECNVCHKGTMVERRGRFGIFYSCSNYPDCKNAIKAKPTGKICPLCQSLMMEGTKTIPERCSNKACPNHNPHKISK